MLTKLYIDQMFRHHDRTFDLSKGMTSITGPNESGKSLIVEAIRYALFGSKALRGTAEDYKKLHVELDFVVNDKNFQVIRKGTKATLTEKGEEGDTPQQASGTKPVNAAIIQILGYDLSVFDVANVINQGEVERLSSMRPAERKAMVDQTVGLNVLDDVIKICGERGNAKRREADAFMSGVTKPTAPAQPEGYTPSKDIPLDDAAKDKDEHLQIKGFLSSAPPKAQKPKKCPVTKTVSELEEIDANRDILKRGTQNTERNIDELEMPQETPEDLDAMEERHTQCQLWKEKKHLLDKGENECPSCGHTWPLAAEALEEYADVVEVSPPKLTRKQIRDQRALQGNEDKKLTFFAKIQELHTALAELPCVKEDLKTRRAYEAELRTYEANREAEKKFNAELSDKRERFETLEGAVEVHEGLRKRYDEAVAYERDVARFEKDQRVYDSNLEAFTKMVEQSDAYLVSRKNVQDLKTQIKQHLLPSLNKVASHLLTQMTGGERSSVDVDPDFEIKIDGQSIGTLSGSGKAVANLAIRIALGQILTNRTFSVLIADEVDGEMDDERAEYTAEALRRLKDRIEQVILVTHKRPETDHRIELKK